MANNISTDLIKAFQGVSDNYRGSTDNPNEIYTKMRNESPVYEGNLMAELGVPSIARHDPTRKTYTLFKYKDVMKVLRDSKTFTSGFIAEGLGAFFDGLILTGMDGDPHKRARSLLTPIFTASAINQWRTDCMDQIILDEYVKPLVQRGQSADLISDMALLFPIRVIYSLIGFPDSRPESVEKFASWALDILAGPQVDPEKAKRAMKKAMDASGELYNALLPIVAMRRDDGATGNDLISKLIAVEDDEGQKLTDHEIATFVRSLLPAAAETTTRTFGTLMVLLLRNPEILQKIRDDRSLINKAIDESVRLEPTATFKIRQTAVDVEIRDVKIPKGSMVSCIVSSANRDEEIFDDPEIFNPFRRARPSFGFGFGAHMCIGMFVAKAEINSALNAILDNMPNIRLDPDKPAPEITGLQLRGPHAVHVIWDQGIKT